MVTSLSTGFELSRPEFPAGGMSGPVRRVGQPLATFRVVDLGFTSGKTDYAEVRNTPDGRRLIFYPNAEVGFKYSLTGPEAYQLIDRESLLSGIRGSLSAGKGMADPSIPSYVAANFMGAGAMVLNSDGSTRSPLYLYTNMQRKSGVDIVNERMGGIRALYDRCGGIVTMDVYDAYHLAQIAATDGIPEDAIVRFLPDVVHADLLGWTGRGKTSPSTGRTSLLMSLKEEEWDPVTMGALDLPVKAFPEICAPGTMLGQVLPEIKEAMGCNSVEVCLVHTHDTAGVAGGFKNAAENFDDIGASTGTWNIQLMFQSPSNVTPRLSDALYVRKFGIEGGRGAEFIGYMSPGGGLFDSLIMDLGGNHKEPDAVSKFLWGIEDPNVAFAFVDVTDIGFDPGKPILQNMLEYCDRTGQQRPQKPEEIAKTAFIGVAMAMADASKMFADIMAMSGRSPSGNFQIGGGLTVNPMLMQLVADLSGLTVIERPIRMAAYGNATLAAISAGLLTPEQARQSIIMGSNNRSYHPSGSNAVAALRQAYLEITGKN